MNEIQARLKALPRKVSVPLEKLLVIGQLDHEIVSTVLDAGELAGDSSKLLGFAAGMVYLKSRNIPVHDVIEMAKKQGRRISLGWSPKRWQEEHDRLSRAETLARLAEQNVEYEVSDYTAHLPARFQGYLIRSSRRLGMEGLRQRHCVASYHQQLLNGHCAIASLFVEGKRWTVQLVATRDESAPLRIVQVKTRYNGLASNEVIKRVHEMLNIKQATEARYERPLHQRESFYMENLRAVLPILRAHGVESVRVTFDGSGDSGSIDGADYDPKIDAEGIRVQMRRTVREFFQGEWRVFPSVEEASLSEAIEDIANDYLQDTRVDWYNDDGGFGSLEIDVVGGTVQLEVNVRYTESNTEFCSNKYIETGEEVP